MPRLRAHLASLLLLGLCAPATVAVGDEAASEPSLRAVSPNPVADGDRGEAVVLEVPPETELGTLTLADGDGAVRLPNVTAGGRVTLSSAPNATVGLPPPVYLLPSGLALANGGETLVLRRDGRVLDTLSYNNAPAGEVYTPADGGWQPVGASDWSVRTAGPGTARAFVLPDAPGVVVDALRRAERRILLAGYTLTSGRVTTALVAAHRRNVTVRVLVDGAPAGGFPAPGARRLDRLAAAGVEVRAIGGPRARYAFHHAKYAVVDGRALVTTENFKPAGTGGRGSRGWGVLTAQSGLVDDLADTFRADAAWRGAVPWMEFRQDLNVTPDTPATATFPRRFDPRRVRVDRARLLVAPDNAERAVVGLLSNATESIRIEQVSTGGLGQPFVSAAVDAARRGVRVRMLLSGAWYARAENRNLTRRLNRLAAREGLPLRARVADPRGRYGKIHAKGVVVDGERVVLGSLNWNNHSARENREVVVVLQGSAPARYFGRVFRADWRGGRWTVPAGLLAGCLAAAAGVVVAGRRVRFVPPGDGGAVGTAHEPERRRERAPPPPEP